MRINENIELLHGDCLEVMKDIPDKSLDMILCDLPYGTTACKWDSIIPFDKLWEQYNRIIKNNGAIVLFADNPFASKLINSNIKMFKYEWIWVKEQGKNFQLAKRQPLKKSEYICVFYKCQPLYNPQGLIKLEKPIVKSNKGKGGRLGHVSSEKKRDTYTQWYTNYPTNILMFNSDRGMHPTQKPVALLEYLIKTYSNENELILDNCMGSGSTGVACINTNRKFIGIEKDDTYFEIAKNRIEESLKTT